MKDELNLTPELLEKAKTAPSAAALLTMAQENGITLTAEDAATFYAQLHPDEGALSDAELDNVAGGCGDSSTKILCPRCKSSKVTVTHMLFECSICSYSWYQYVGK